MPREVYRLISELGKPVWGTRSKGAAGYFKQVTLSENGWSCEMDSFQAKRILAPVGTQCPAVWCVGLNYKLHAKETGFEIPKRPTLFMKGINTIIGPEEAIKIPKVCKNEVDFEGEIAVIISKTCRDVSEEDALDYVLGYTVANDVSARRWQGKKGGGQWVRSKSFDTFLPLGPCIVKTTGDMQLQTALIRDGKRTIVQESCASDMIFSIPQLIAFISQDTTLLPGTIILTGTPHGVGYTRKPPIYLQPNDQVEVSIHGIGKLTNRVL